METISNTNMGIINLVLVFIIIMVLGIAFKGYKDFLKNEELEKKEDSSLNTTNNDNDNEN